MKKPVTLTYTRTALKPDDCYCSASVSCKNNNTVLNHNATSSQSSSSSSGLFQFLRKNIALFAAALGIEILYIAAAEIGENTGLYLFGSDLAGIPIAYAMRYVLAGFIIFATILGRYSLAQTGILIVAALYWSRLLVQASCLTSGLRLGTLQLELQ